MLVGVGPFALGAGLVTAGPATCTVHIYNMNTEKLIDTRIETPGSHVHYDGNTRAGDGGAAEISGLPQCGCAKTGRLFPTGNPIDVVGDVKMSLVDAAMPIMPISP